MQAAGISDAAHPSCRAPVVSTLISGDSITNQLVWTKAAGGMRARRDCSEQDQEKASKQTAAAKEVSMDATMDYRNRKIKSIT